MRETAVVVFGARDAMKSLEMLEYPVRRGMRRYDNELQMGAVHIVWIIDRTVPHPFGAFRTNL